MRGATTEQMLIGAMTAALDLGFAAATAQHPQLELLRNG